jgi:undecaprenyl-diphosphatase
MLCFCLWMAVQIVLESFPISSSGHLVLLERFMHKVSASMSGSSLMMDYDFFDSALLRESVVHFLHGPTLLVIAIVFFSSWFFLIIHPLRCWRIIAKALTMVIITDTVTTVGYVFFACTGVDWFPLVAGFFITMVSLASLHFCPLGVSRPACWRAASVLGLVQGIALLPGISRLASTFVAARWLGFSSRRALEYSLLIQVPLIAAAFAQSVYRLQKYDLWHYVVTGPTIVTLMGATCLALIALVWVKRLALEDRLWFFAWYMVVPITLALVL